MVNELGAHEAEVVRKIDVPTDTCVVKAVDQFCCRGGLWGCLDVKVRATAPNTDQ